MRLLVFNGNGSNGSNDIPEYSGAVKRVVRVFFSDDDAVEILVNPDAECSVLRSLIQRRNLFCIDVGVRPREALNFSEIEGTTTVLRDVDTIQLSDGTLLHANTGWSTHETNLNATYNVRAAIVQSSTTQVYERLTDIMASDDQGGDTLILCDIVNVPRWKQVLLQRFCSSDVAVVRRTREGFLTPYSRVTIITHNTLCQRSTDEQLAITPPGPFQRLIVSDAHNAQYLRNNNIPASFTWFVSDSFDVTLPTHALSVLNMLNIQNDSPVVMSQVIRMVVHSMPVLEQSIPELLTVNGLSNGLGDLLGAGSMVNTVTHDRLQGVEPSRHDIVRAELWGSPPSECGICYSAAVDSVTQCGHTFCISCISRCYGRCPTCRSTPVVPLRAVDNSNVPAKIQWLHTFSMTYRLTIVLMNNAHIQSVSKIIRNLGIRTTCMRNVSRMSAGGMLSQKASRGMVLVGFSERACVDMTNVGAVVMVDVPTKYSFRRWSG